MTPKPISPTVKIRRAAEQVAERAADQQQRAEREQVGLDDPLLRARPVSRSSRIDGSATLTTVPSTKTTAEPRMQAISVRRLVRASAI